jgi:hypothetical protein
MTAFRSFVELPSLPNNVSFASSNTLDAFDPLIIGTPAQRGESSFRLRFAKLLGARKSAVPTSGKPPSAASAAPTASAAPIESMVDKVNSAPPSNHAPSQAKSLVSGSTANKRKHRDAAVDNDGRTSRQSASSRSKTADNARVDDLRIRAVNIDYDANDDDSEDDVLQQKSARVSAPRPHDVEATVASNAAERSQKSQPAQKEEFYDIAFTDNDEEHATSSTTTTSRLTSGSNRHERLPWLTEGTERSVTSVFVVQSDVHS